jgi:tetratricopeptide (TPR) repeat protein
MFWPSGLALFYPFEQSSVTPLRVAGAVALLAAMTCFVVVQRKTRPYLVFGWFWYLITLLPVIGFIRVGSQSMADRYTYIPLIGLFLVVVWGGAEIAGRWRYGLPATAGGTVITIAVLSVLAATQIRYWQNSYDLYTHALAVVGRNWLAHNNLAILLAQQYRYDEAIRHFRESLRINPVQAKGFRNLGNAYQSVGRNPEAIEAFREAVRINPNDVEGHFRLGYAYLLSGNIDLAYQEYLQLRRLDEKYAQPLLDSIKRSGR